MKLHEIRPAKGATKKEKRLGRGEASGHGGTSTKGNKGHQSRSGFKNRRAHEGGQMPIQRRTPKFGFKNNNKIYYKPVNLDLLEELAAKLKSGNLSLAVFRQNGLIGKNDRIKLLGRGEIKAKVAVEAHAFSEKASKAIEQAGGSVTKVA